jgi:hypothetical protein
MNNPRVAEQLMQALASGRGNNYGYQYSQRPAAGTIRGISNADPISIGAGMGGPTMPDYAGRGYGRGSSMGTGEVGGKFSGLSAEEDLLLNDQGYIDKGGVRYIIDRNTGYVTQNRIPSGPTSGNNFGSRGQTMAQAVGGPGAMKPDFGGMLPELEKQMMEEKYRRQGR